MSSGDTRKHPASVFFPNQLANGRLPSGLPYRSIIFSLTGTSKQRWQQQFEEETVSNESDQLLYVLTAKREISWSAYKTVIDEIFRTSPTFRMDVASLRGRILRLFDAFGFCDLTFNEGAGRVFVCPATPKGCLLKAARRYSSVPVGPPLSRTSIMLPLAR